LEKPDVENYDKRVLVIDENLIDLLKAQDSLETSGYKVSKLSGPSGCLAKVDYECPAILLVDISMSRLNAQSLFDGIRNNSEHEDLIIVLFSDLDADTLQELCVEHDFHGYYCKSMGIENLGDFLDNFYDDEASPE
jgi:PleD family two-component response regulator